MVMRRTMWAALAVSAGLSPLASGCGADDDVRGAPDVSGASPEVITQLARSERSVEEFDVCEAIRAARGDDDLVRLVGGESVSVVGTFVDSEDAAVADCSVRPEGTVDVGLQVSLSQGTEFRGAKKDDPVVFAGCRVASPESRGRTTWVRVTCHPDLTVDAVLTSGGDAKAEPDALVDLLHDVLSGVSQQG
jgi:hypothetical protein